MVDFAEEVEAVIKGVTKDDAGKNVFPEGTTEAHQFAATSELRRRDTQSALTKEQEGHKTSKAENTKLTEAWAAEVASVLTPTQSAELEELKNTDPDAWRTKLNEIEATNQTSLKERQTKISADAGTESELERRTSVLEAHNVANPDHQLTQDVIDNDIPPRMYKKLTNGEITFDQFLEDASGYLKKGKVVGDVGDIPSDEPNLSDLGGDDKPSTANVEASITESYEKETY